MVLKEGREWYIRFKGKCVASASRLTWASWPDSPPTLLGQNPSFFSRLALALRQLVIGYIFVREMASISCTL